MLVDPLIRVIRKVNIELVIFQDKGIISVFR